ncbi:MAG: hypothetical protein RR626_07355, partial [Anaerovoracaceae bacterium]
APLTVKSFPLGQLQSIKKELPAAPACTKSISILPLSLDFEAPIERKKEASLNLFDALDLPLSFSGFTSCPQYEFSTLYLNYSSHRECISLLKQLIRQGALPTEEIKLMDTKENLNGLFTINGLKKPLFYLYTLLPPIFSSLCKSGENYMITREEQRYYLYTYNESEQLPLSVELNFYHIHKPYTLTIKRLIEERSCINYWSQLNFKNNITQKEYDYILAMSTPQVSFSTLPIGEHCEIGLQLSPKEILCIEMEELST